MKVHEQAGIVLAVVGGILCGGCSKTAASAVPVDSQALIQAVHNYGLGHTASPEPKFTPPADGNNLSIIHDEDDYQSQVTVWLLGHQYDQLDSEVRALRKSKERMRGGTWKLYMFYTGLQTPAADAKATDADWESQIVALNAWAKAKPESAAPHIALAGAYFTWGEAAHGTGYANTVSSEGWRLLAERNNLGKAQLLTASQLQEKDVRWYEMMLLVATNDSWSKEDAHELFKQAIAFEPDYYHVYREYALYLLPKWNGEPGDVEAFANGPELKADTPAGDFEYFEVASVIACQCDSSESNIEQLSWPRIKAGYQAMLDQWGTSRLNANRYAHMAWESGDQAAAHDALLVVGLNWELSTWHSRENFDRVRAWALN